MFVDLFTATNYHLPPVRGINPGFVDSDDIPPDAASPEKLKAHLIARIQDMSADELRYYTRTSYEGTPVNLKWAVAATAHIGIVIRYKDGRLGWNHTGAPGIEAYSDQYFMSEDDLRETSYRKEDFFISEIEFLQGIKPFPVNVTCDGETRALNIGAWLMHRKVGQSDIEAVVNGDPDAQCDLVISYISSGCPSVADLDPDKQFEIEVDAAALREYFELRRPDLMDFQASQPTP